MQSYYACAYSCGVYVHGNVGCVTKWIIELIGTNAENQGMSNLVCEEISA